MDLWRLWIETKLNNKVSWMMGAGRRFQLHATRPLDPWLMLTHAELVMNSVEIKYQLPQSQHWIEPLVDFCSISASSVLLCLTWNWRVIEFWWWLLTETIKSVSERVITTGCVTFLGLRGQCCAHGHVPVHVSTHFLTAACSLQC
jgi:hypothetical protein